MTELLNVEKFVIEQDVLDATIEVLAEAGLRGVEAFVVWSGAISEPGVFRFSSWHRPEQVSTAGREGCLVTVDGDELFALNRAAFALGEILAAQVHSHPTEAFHSQTDDTYPLVTLPGSVSLVVHDFARHRMEQIERWAWYRLAPDGAWRDLSETAEVVIV